MKDKALEALEKEYKQIRANNYEILNHSLFYKDGLTEEQYKRYDTIKQSLRSNVSEEVKLKSISNSISDWVNGVVDNQELLDKCSEWFNNCINKKSHFYREVYNNE